MGIKFVIEFEAYFDNEVYEYETEDEIIAFEDGLQAGFGNTSWAKVWTLEEVQDNYQKSYKGYDPEKKKELITLLGG